MVEGAPCIRSEWSTDRSCGTQAALGLVCKRVCPLYIEQCTADDYGGSALCLGTQNLWASIHNYCHCSHPVGT